MEDTAKNTNFQKNLNGNFLCHMKACKKTAYQISKETGIPYTTISELANGKININKCAADTVFRLSLYFQCTMDEILNKISLLTNVSGTYRSIKYQWKPSRDDSVELHIWDCGEERVLDKGKYSQARFYKVYGGMTEQIIDGYIEEKEGKALLNESLFLNA